MGETWVLAFQYPNMERARKGWKRVRDMIFADDLDASVYRSLIDGGAYVVVVGNQCLKPELQQRFADSCAGAVLTLIPERVAGYLVERRHRSAVPGTFWERRSTS